MVLPQDFAVHVNPEKITAIAAKTFPPAAVAGIGTQGMANIGVECTGQGGVFCGTSTGKGGHSM